MDRPGVVVEEGLVVEFQGKFWGTLYADGQSTSLGWGDIKQAKLCNPEFCFSPTDLTYQDSPHRKELAKGHLIKVRRITSVEVIE